MTDPITSAAAVFDTPSEPKPARIEDAAKQFEALLIGQMLRSAREAASGDDDDSTRSTMLDIGDQQFSKLLANNGGMGLARMVVSGLEQSTREKTNAN